MCTISNKWLLAASLKEKCFLLENRRVTIHEMSQGSQIVLIKEGDGKFRLKQEISVTPIRSHRWKPKPTAPLIPNALIVRQLNPSKLASREAESATKTYSLSPSCCFCT